MNPANESAVTARGVVRPISVPKAFIEKARDGDQRSFELIYTAYSGPVLRYLRTIAPGIAEDVSASTWESVAASLDRFRGDGDGFRAWIFTIARRRLADEVRRRSRRPLVLVDEFEDGEDRSQPAVDAFADAGWAGEILRRIPARQADVVSLRVVAGLSVGEVAELLGISKENVRVLSHRALQAIQAELTSTPELLDGRDDPGQEIRLTV